MNNKGFMMAEVVVVASIVLVTMAGMYASYNKIFALYNQRIDYYDVATLYELGDYKKNNFNTSNIENPVDDDENGRKIYYIKREVLEKYKDNVDLLIVSSKLEDYLKFLSTSLDFDSNGADNFLIMEKCAGIEGNDADDCKYAYLEVYDE